MEALVTVETILLILLSLLVAGLLRSHAEILRRLEAPAPAARAETRRPGTGGAAHGAAREAPADGRSGD